MVPPLHCKSCRGLTSERPEIRYKPHNFNSNGTGMKKACSTGDLTDERSTMVGLERRLLKRRGKCRIDDRIDVSEGEVTQTGKSSVASGTMDTDVSHSPPLESTEKINGPNNFVLLKANRINRVLSSAQREIITIEKNPPLPHLGSKSPRLGQRLHSISISAKAPSDRTTQLSPRIDYVSGHKTINADRTTQHTIPSRHHQHESNISEFHRKDRDRRPTFNKRSNSMVLSRLDESRSSVDGKFPSSVTKPQLTRIQTAPSSIQSLKVSLVDDALMNRALTIRDDLRQHEMRELAAEAERAAESGLEKFVGSASKFVTEQRTSSNQFGGVSTDDDFILSTYDLESPYSKKSSLVSCHPMEYTPLYFNKKKIRVTALREFSEVVPNFMEMHHNIRIHLGQHGVDTSVLPDEEQHRMNSSHDVDEDDLQSQANESHAGSIASFGSFAVASLRGIVDFVGSSRSKSSTKNHTVPTMPQIDPPYDNRHPYAISQSSPDRVNSSCSSEFETDPASTERFGSRRPKNQQCTFTENSTAQSDSDDSSVELYGRKRVDGRASPSSVNGVMGTCYSNDQLRRQELSAGSTTFDEEKSQVPSIMSPSVISIDTKQSVANFFSRIQNKFSRSLDDPKKATSTEVEENGMFISNYFYTNQDVETINPEGLSYLKLDINPDPKNNDGFCISCGHNDVISSCETVGKLVDLVFNWFNERGDCDQSFQSKSPDTKSSYAVLHNSWVKNWHTDGIIDRRLFVPPRLAVRH